MRPRTLPLWSKPNQPPAIKPARILRQLNRAPDGADWEKLFAFQLDHAEPAVPPYLRDYRFAKSLGRRFEADFAWLPRAFPLRGIVPGLLVEVQGGIWRRYGGAHSRPDHIERDIEKAQCAALLGYTLLPVTPQDVKSGHALELVQTVLHIHAERPMRGLPELPGASGAKGVC
jgi:hypothetical protein